jgi:uncharacterized protein
MVDRDRSDEGDLPAGDFAQWMIELRGALRGERTADVPCDGCTACCTSSQFVHIAPEETDTLARIPAELLFPAPQLPSGHVVLGYDEHGRCPMLIDEACSIYEDRPTACRTYDCRIFPAAAVDADDSGNGDGTKVLIARRARRWRFSFPTDADRNQRDAVIAAADFLRRHVDVLPNGVVPTSPTGLALLAIGIHERFLRRDGDSGATSVVDPDPDVVRSELQGRTGASQR